MQSLTDALQAHKAQLQMEIKGLSQPSTQTQSPPGKEPPVRVFEVLARQLEAQNVCTQRDAADTFRLLLDNSKKNVWSSVPINDLTRWLDENGLVKTQRQPDTLKMILW